MSPYSWDNNRVKMSIARTQADGKRLTTVQEVFGVERELELVRDGAMTIEDAMRFTGVGRSFLYEAMAKGELPFIKIGSARRIPRRALEEWLARHVVTGRQTGTEG